MEPGSESGIPHGHEHKEVLPPKRFELQTPRQFRDDFVRTAKTADTIGLETMQFEICDDTMPIFDAMIHAKDRGADVGFHYDRFARHHIRVGESDGNAFGGRLVRKKGDKEALQAAFDAREDMIKNLVEKGIVRPTERKGTQHNHVKLAIADDAAWLKTLNLRAIDFDLSNFAIKIIDPAWVAVMKDIYTMTEDPTITEDRVFKQDHDPDNELLLDAGVKGQSVIYNRAVQMAESLMPGDRFTFITQYPPTRLVLGNFFRVLEDKTAGGVNGRILMSTEDHIHPLSRTTSRLTQRHIERKNAANPNLVAENLPRDTHAKAFIITRGDGSQESLVGSHNLTTFTVRNGTRELASWSRDPQMTGQIDSYLEGLRSEPVAT